MQYRKDYYKQEDRSEVVYKYIVLAFAIAVLVSMVRYSYLLDKIAMQ